MRPSFALSVTSKDEGAGNAGCTSHPLPCVQMKKDARRPTQVRRNHSDTPCAMVLRLLRDLPGEPAFLPPSPRALDPKGCPLHWRDRTTRLDRTRRAARLAARPRPSHPCPRIVAI